MIKIKKNFYIIMLFLFLLFLSSCTRTTNEHSKIEKYIKNRYSDDKLTYESTGPLNWYNGIDEFYMYSTNLNDKFKVVAKNWRTESPIIEDNYISKKYAKQVENMYLDLLDGYIKNFKIGQIDCRNLLINTNDIDANISFDDWWNNYGKYSNIYIMALVKNINSVYSNPLYENEDHSQQVYQTNQIFEKLKENNFYNTPIYIVWLDEHSYYLNFSDITEGAIVFNTYFALSRIKLEDENDFNTYKLKWFDPLESEWVETNNPIGKRSIDIISDIKIKNKSEANNNVENTENIEGITDIINNTSNKPIVDTSSSVIMPDPDELQEKLEKGEQVIYNPSLN